MNISDEGLELIKSFEGLRLNAYKAVSTEKYYTIGYGHYGQDVSPAMTISEAQAEELLRKDIAKFEAYVNNYNKQYNFNQCQFDALVSFTYNCGLGNLRQLTGYGKRTKEQIRDKIKSYNKSGGKILAGLVRRREAEYNLYIKDDTVLGTTTDKNILNNSVLITEVPGMYIVNVNRLNVRAGMSTKFAVDRVVEKGDIINVSAVYKTTDGDLWGVIDGGFVAINYKGKDYMSIYVQSSVKQYSLIKDGNTKLSGNFKVSEFKCKDGSDLIKIDSKLVNYLQLIRNHFGKAVIINSGYRTETYNKKVGGASKSYHVRGQAADIHINGINVKDIAAYAESIGILGIGLYIKSGFVHVDTRTTKYFWINASGNSTTTFK